MLAIGSRECARVGYLAVVRVLTGVLSACVLAATAQSAVAGPGGTIGNPGAEEVKARKGPLFHPDGPGKYRWRAAVGITLDVLPRRVVESEMRTSPLLTGYFRFGLPVGFSVDTRLSAVYISNQIDLGVAWSHRIKNFSFGVQDHAGIWFGALGFEGFDASGRSLVNSPGASIGLAVGDHRFTLLSEGLFTFYQHTTLGDSRTVEKKSARFAGMATTLVVESFFGKGSAVYYGFGLLWTLPDYQAWIAFSDSRTRAWYPRFLAGYAF